MNREMSDLSRQSSAAFMKTTHTVYIVYLLAREAIMFGHTISDRSGRIQRLTVWAKWLFKVVTEHHQLHSPEPVGMFAGSLLARSDWDH
jgi:hypothetical protein